MHSNAMKLLVQLSQIDDPIANAVRESTESGFVIGKLLKPELEKAGFRIEQSEMKVLTRVEVFEDEKLLASGASVDASDALVHAALGYLRNPEEERLDAEQRAP
jgi:hypothetical protein